MLTTYRDGVAKNGIYWRWYGRGSGAKTAPPLVMVMGYGGNLATWSDQFLERLSARDEMHGGVLVFDHPGSGASAAVPEEAQWTFADFARMVREMMDEMEILKANVYGYSMGGCISLEFVRAFPQRVNKLLLCATTAGGKLFQNSSPEIAERIRNPRGNTFDEMYFDFISFSMPEPAIEANRATLQAICDATRDPMTPRYVLEMKLRAFRLFDGSDVLDSINCPTLVIHGNSDELMPTINGIRLADNIKGAQRVLIDDCGHYPHIEKQPQMLDAVSSFFAR